MNNVILWTKIQKWLPCGAIEALWDAAGALMRDKRPADDQSRRQIKEYVTRTTTFHAKYFAEPRLCCWYQGIYDMHDFGVDGWNHSHLCGSCRRCQMVSWGVTLMCLVNLVNQFMPCMYVFVCLCVCVLVCLYMCIYFLGMVLIKMF